MRPSSLLQSLRGRVQRDDEGVALITVVGTMGVVTALALSALFLVVGATPRARADQDSSTALAAAQAGVDEYVSRLNANDTYWTNASVDATNGALTTPAGFAAAPGRALPGTTTGATFKYTVLNSTADISASGLIQLKVAGTSTAPSGVRSTRTLLTTLKVKGFLNYIYFSDVEALDPALWSSSAGATYNGQSTVYVNNQSYTFRANPNRVQADCSAKYWDGRTSKAYTAKTPTSQAPYDTASVISGGQVVGTVPGWNGSTSGSVTIGGYCTQDISFIAGDVINGPLHSNDLLRMIGDPLFANSDTTVYAGPSATDASDLWWGGGAPSAGTASKPGYRPTRSPLPTTLPNGNSELLRYVEPKVDTDPNTNRPGCLYRGATKITFTGKTMTVLSPNTTDAPARCLNTANRAQSQSGLAIPPVIYVAAATGTCSGVGYPAAAEATAGLITTNYDCTRGTAFVSGSVDAAVTVAGADDIVVVGDTTYADGGAGTDVLGLVATGFIWVYHPITSSGNNLTQGQGYTPVYKVQAGILSLSHSFLVQNWNRGQGLSDGSTATKLNVLGAIAQAYRGPVGTGGGNTGYLKNYIYDTRFAGLQPPFFIKPVKSPWAVQSVSDAPSGS